MFLNYSCSLPFKIVKEIKSFIHLFFFFSLNSVFCVSSESTIKALWIRMRKEEEPDVLENFEDFLCKVSKEIKRSHGDFKTLEAALKRLVCSLNKHPVSGM